MLSRVSDRFRSEWSIKEIPEHALSNVVQIPSNQVVSPLRLIIRRFAIAAVLIIVVSLVAYLDREGYSEDLTFIDALYYSAVTLSTTGYGDITPVTQSARLMNIFIVTPLRLAFLILLVGTTLSVLTEESRKVLQIQR